MNGGASFAVLTKSTSLPRNLHLKALRRGEEFKARAFFIISERVYGFFAGLILLAHFVSFARVAESSATTWITKPLSVKKIS